MKDELVKFETAVLAKEIGFDIETFYYYTNIKTPTSPVNIQLRGLYGCMHNSKKARFAAPTQSLLQRWLREKHNIHIYVEPVWPEDDNIEIPEYVGWYITVGFDEGETSVYYTTYEEALEQTLFEALTWLKEKLNDRQ